MNFFRKYRVHIIMTLVAVFVYWIALGVREGFQKSPTDTFLEVNGHKVPLYAFENHFYRALSQVPQGTKIDEGLQNAKREEVIRDLVRSIVLEEQARRYHIDVPDLQV